MNSNIHGVQNKFCGLVKFHFELLLLLRWWTGSIFVEQKKVREIIVAQDILNDLNNDTDLFKDVYNWWRNMEI